MLGCLIGIEKIGNKLIHFILDVKINNISYMCIKDGAGARR